MYYNADGILDLYWGGISFDSISSWTLSTVGGCCLLTLYRVIEFEACHFYDPQLCKRKQQTVGKSLSVLTKYSCWFFAFALACTFEDWVMMERLTKVFAFYMFCKITGVEVAFLCPLLRMECPIKHECVLYPVFCLHCHLQALLVWCKFLYSCVVYHMQSINALCHLNEWI